MTDNDQQFDWKGYSDGLTWVESQRPGARLTRPIREFMHVETAGGIVLLIATVAALALANSPLGEDVAEFWHEDLTLFAFRDFHLTESLLHWINDGLMTIFFFVVGLEIKQELVSGELRDPRRAAIAGIGALGGMIVPAAFYIAFNAGGPGADGWGIPMATDIAFAVGVMALLGPRVATPLKVFLLTLAIVDDIGAILVIAVFYTDDISWGWLAIAIALIGLTVFMRLIRIWWIPLYVIVGTGVWLATLESGIHATIAGVVLGLITPAKPLRPQTTALEIEPDNSWDTIRSVLFDAKETIPVAERLQHIVHPWSAFVILPIFAFANAGVELSNEAISDAFSSPVTQGIIVGLVVGKPLGIYAAARIAVAARIAKLPEGVSWTNIAAAGAIAGIGFTVSLFVTGLAFSDPEIIDEAKIGVVVASVIAAIAGAALFSLGRSGGEDGRDDADVVSEDTYSG